MADPTLSPEAEAARASFQDKLRSLSFRPSTRAPKVTTDVHDHGVVHTIEHARTERQDILVQPKTAHFEVSARLTEDEGAK